MSLFVHEIPVRYADTDAQGHVFFANYFTYFDEAMTGYLHAIGYPPSAMAAAGIDVVYADAQCTYRGSARFEDRVHVGFSVRRVGKTSLSAEVSAAVNGEVIARGKLIFVCVSSDDYKKVEVPGNLRDAIEQFEAKSV
jgi:acyl-CoA thioester hydrolase